MLEKNSYPRLHSQLFDIAYDDSLPFPSCTNRAFKTYKLFLPYGIESHHHFIKPVEKYVKDASVRFRLSKSRTRHTLFPLAMYSWISGKKRFTSGTRSTRQLDFILSAIFGNPDQLAASRSHLENGFGIFKKPLICAVLAGNYNTAMALIDMGADTRCLNRWPLPEAAFSAKDPRLFEILLKSAYDYDFSCDLLRTLIIAGHSLAKEVILGAKSVNKDEHSLARLLMVAIASKQVEMARLLIANGANVNYREFYPTFKPYHLTPLSFAASRGLRSLAELLISSGAFLDPRGAYRNNQKLYKQKVSTEPKKEGIRRNLKPEGYIDLSYDRMKGHGPTALTMAAFTGDLDMVKFLLQAGLDVNGKGTFAPSPLIHACFGGHIEVAKFLIQNRAVYVSTSHIKAYPISRPLEAAACSGNSDLVDLLKSGTDPRLAPRDSRYEQIHWQHPSALLCACLAGNRQSVELLIENGADLNESGYFSYLKASPAAICKHLGHYDILSILTDEKLADRKGTIIGQVLNLPERSGKDIIDQIWFKKWPNRKYNTGVGV
jgi:ankyrin repeat protein